MMAENFNTSAIIFLVYRQLESLAEEYSKKKLG